MSYQPLARKYRPQKFDDLVGQQSVVMSLSNAIRLKRIVPCLIFAGVRGIGKTTVARLYAKALNCENGPTHEPCNTCESCKAIVSGLHEDVIEIDGASNNGVDDVRLLQETLGYVPQRSKFKVYIIDEVHMLTANAFNALLKTLEEPPSHVVFIFATTELRQIPDTILGRCQVYHLRKLSIEQISIRLQEILGNEGIEFDHSAIEIVAKEGQGSMRDAITFLDQLIALGGGKLDYRKICEMIAYVPSSMCLEFIRNLISLDVLAVLELVNQWDQKGVSFTDALDEISRNIRNICVVKELGRQSQQLASLGIESQSLDLLEQTATKASANELHALFKSILDCRSQLSGSFTDRYLVDNYVMEWVLSRKSENAQVNKTNQLNHPILQQTDIIKPKKSDLSTQGEKKTVDIGISSKGMVPISENSSFVMKNDSRNEGTGTRQEGKAESNHPVGHTYEKPDASELSFPESWKILVDRWKRKKPLKARIIEEAHLVEYSQSKIVLAVDPASLAGRELLRIDAQKEIGEQFKLLFGFTGVLSVNSRESLANRNPNDSSEGGENQASPDRHEESLLETRKKEKDQYNNKIVDNVTNHKVTQKALSLFNGEVESIEVKHDEFH